MLLLKRQDIFILTKFQRPFDIHSNAHTYAVTATSSISGWEINTASKSAGAICRRDMLYTYLRKIHA